MHLGHSLENLPLLKHWHDIKIVRDMERRIASELRSSKPSIINHKEVGAIANVALYEGDFLEKLSENADYLRILAGEIGNEVRGCWDPVGSGDYN